MAALIPDEVDAVVVGAGPAGSAAAAGLARRGLKVALLERARFPRDKVCGDFLTPGSVRRLRAMYREAGGETGDGAAAGLEAESPCLLRGMRITFEGIDVVSDFPHGAEGWSLSRRRLDAALARRAARAGADLVEEIQVDRFGTDADGARWVEGRHPDGARRRWRARLLVEAGGRHGLVGRRLGLRAADPRLVRHALWSHMDGVRGMSDRGEMHLFDGGYVGVAPLDHAIGLANVTMVLTPRSMRRARRDARGFFLDRLRGHPELGRRLAAARLATPLAGAGPLACTSSRVTAAGLAMVGDACGFVDPFTGEGVFVALESSRLMVEADASGALDRYERDYRDSFAAKLRLCRLLQAAIARPWLARRIARALAARKDLADRMVGATGDLLPPSSVLNPSYLGRLLLAGMTA